MTRMGKLIAHHMIESISTSAHVQSFIEVDVTKVVAWRNKVKDAFPEKRRRKVDIYAYFYGGCGKGLEEIPNGQHFSRWGNSDKEKEYQYWNGCCIARW